MKSAMLLTLTGLLVSGRVALGQPRIHDGLLVAAGRSLPSISTNVIFRALETGLWNSERTAVAIAIPNPKATLLCVFLRQTNVDYVAVDVSGMEGANLGHLGTAGLWQRI